MDEVYYNETQLSAAPLFTQFDGVSFVPLAPGMFADDMTPEQPADVLHQTRQLPNTPVEGSSVVSADSGDFFFNSSSLAVLDPAFGGRFFEVGVEQADSPSLEDSHPDAVSVSSSASIGALNLNPLPLHASLPLEIQFAAPVVSQDSDSAVPTKARESSAQTAATPTDVSSNDLPAFKLLKKAPTTQQQEGVDPTDIDVLCGKGGKTLLHNRHFTQLCSRYATQYSETKKRGSNGKRGIALTIVREVQGNNGRFLKPQDTGSDWEVISDELAMNKVAHCIRDLIRRLKNEKVR
jgi:hypothetical protein